MSKKSDIQIIEDVGGNIDKVKLFGFLNEVDWAIIFYLGQEPRSVGVLGKKLNIAGVNVWKHLNKLKQEGIINVPDVKRGKKKMISLKDKGYYDMAMLIYKLRTKKNK